MTNGDKTRSTGSRSAATGNHRLLTLAKKLFRNSHVHCPGTMDEPHLLVQVLDRLDEAVFLFDRDLCLMLASRTGRLHLLAEGDGITPGQPFETVLATFGTKARFDPPRSTRSLADLVRDGEAWQIRLRIGSSAHRLICCPLPMGGVMIRLIDAKAEWQGRRQPHEMQACQGGD